MIRCARHPHCRRANPAGAADARLHGKSLDLRPKSSVYGYSPRRGMRYT
jgi:hypothetical protein